MTRPDLLDADERALADALYGEVEPPSTDAQFIAAVRQRRDRPRRPLFTFALPLAGAAAAAAAFLVSPAEPPPAPEALSGAALYASSAPVVDEWIDDDLAYEDDLDDGLGEAELVALDEDEDLLDEDPLDSASTATLLALSSVLDEKLSRHPRPHTGDPR